MPTILIIDDHESIRLALAQIVEQMEHEAITAPSGAEGLELFRTREVDFVITDLKMEGVDGVGVLRGAREMDPDSPSKSPATRLKAMNRPKGVMTPSLCKYPIFSRPFPTLTPERRGSTLVPARSTSPLHGP